MVSFSSLTARALGLVLFISSLCATASGQHLFPVNEQGQVPFGVHCNNKDVGTSGGAGELWTADGRPPRIAIIGAGAAGASAAFYLAHFGALEKLGLQTEVTIFERSDYVGGRSTVVWPWNSDPYATPGGSNLEVEEPVELGASIFVEVSR